MLLIIKRLDFHLTLLSSVTGDSIVALCQEKTLEVLESSHPLTGHSAYTPCLYLQYRPNTLTVHCIVFHQPPKWVDVFHNWSIPLLPSAPIQFCLSNQCRIKMEMKQYLLFKRLPSLCTRLPVGYSQNLTGAESLALPSLFPIHCSQAGCRLSPQTHPHPDLIAFASAIPFP